MDKERFAALFEGELFRDSFQGTIDEYQMSAYVAQGRHDHHGRGREAIDGRTGGFVGEGNELVISS